MIVNKRNVLVDCERKISMLNARSQVAIHRNLNHVQSSQDPERPFMKDIFTIDAMSLIRNSSISKTLSRDAPKYTEIAPPIAPRYDQTVGYFFISSTVSVSRLLMYMFI